MQHNFDAFFKKGIFNIPKFFEFELYVNANDEYDYQTSLLNEDEFYIAFCSWWNDLIVFGIIPLVSLVVFNLKIYLKVRTSDKQEYRFVGRKPPFRANSGKRTFSYDRQEDNASGKFL